MFWTLILIICQLHSEKNKVSRDVCKKLHFKINFRSILGPPNVPRIYKKSVLEVILGQEGSREISSSANMAPRTDLDRFSIDFSLIWGWIVQALATKLRIPDRRHRPQGLYKSTKTCNANPPRCEGFTATPACRVAVPAKSPSCTSTVQLLAHFL